MVKLCKKKRRLIVIMTILALCAIVLSAGAENEMVSNTLPEVWRTDVAPDFYWDKLEEVIAGRNVATLLKQWSQEYGEVPFFWPLEYQALSYVWTKTEWDNIVGSGFCGLPGEDDLPYEQALDLAWQYFLKDCTGIYTNEETQLFTVEKQFVYHFYLKGNSVWTIYFYNTEGNQRYYIEIDAKTRAIIQHYLIEPVG